MPETGPTLKFENNQREQKVPYVIYADFESIIEKLPDGRREKSEKTEKTARHVGCGYAYTVVSSDGKSWSRKYRQGEDGKYPAAEEFLKAMLGEEEKIREKIREELTISLTRSMASAVASKLTEQKTSGKG